MTTFYGVVSCASPCLRSRFGGLAIWRLGLFLQRNNVKNRGLIRVATSRPDSNTLDEFLLGFFVSRSVPTIIYRVYLVMTTPAASSSASSSSSLDSSPSSSSPSSGAPSPSASSASAGGLLHPGHNLDERAHGSHRTR